MAPSLGDAPIRKAGEGWDNVLFAVGDHFFRFPRRHIAIDGVRTEIAALPVLAARLPAPIPTPLWSSNDELPFFGYFPVAGREVRPEKLAPAARLTVAAELGRFLAALHAPETLELARDLLPGDRFGRAQIVRRLPKIREQVAELPDELRELASPLLDDLERLEASPLPVAVVHGDLHLRHVLVDDATLTGVIDWGDVHVGAAAVDLCAYWMLFEEAERAAFLEGYGRLPSEAELTIARIVGLYISLALRRSAPDFDLPDVASAAECAMVRICGQPI